MWVDLESEEEKGRCHKAKLEIGVLGRTTFIVGKMFIGDIRLRGVLFGDVSDIDIGARSST